MHDAKAAHRIRVQVERFSGNLCAGLAKVARRAVREVLYGIQARGSVRLSEIARSLKESTGLKKVIERLGRQLERPGLREQVRANHLREAARWIDEDTLLVVDPTDLTKPYGRKMEHLAQVRDGSEKKLAPGYWCMTVVATRRQSAQVVPLYQELYSQEAPDFRSENQEILKAIEAVEAVTGGRGVWVMDRGGDRRNLLVPSLRKGRQLLVRLEGARHLLVGKGKGEQKRAARELADAMPLPYRQSVVREGPERENIRRLRFGVRRVRLPELPKMTLSLLVIKGFGKHPLMLLTSLRAGRSRRSVWRLVQAYLSRWRVEETIRFVKQSYQLEDIRLLRYERLRTMVTLVMAAAYFAAVYLGRRAKLRVLAHHMFQAAQRIYGIPEFRLYALADGIKQLLFGSRRGPAPPTTTQPQEQFILLPFG